MAARSSGAANVSRGPARSYDPDEVLDRVMRVFWRRGYAAKPMRELRNATGLGSRSLYDDFGNKRALFHAALARYRERCLLPLYEPLRTGDSPLAALHAFIDRFEAMRPSDMRLGCLVVIAMAQTVRGEDHELADEIAMLAEEMRHWVEEAIRSAVDSGELNATVSPSKLAALLVTTLQGAHLAGRVRPSGGLRADALSAARHLLDAMATVEVANPEEGR
jgi:TetR/AcrR family transcriptional repressor of nem operon